MTPTLQEPNKKPRITRIRRIRRMKRRILHEELSGQIIGAAMAVLNELKPGLDEKLYERAMVIELRERGHLVDPQHSFPVFYRTELIGNFIPDLIVDNSVIVDAKVVSAFSDTHVAQMIGYLSITGLELGLLLNFQSAQLDWQRAVRQSKLESDLPDLHAS